MTTRSTADALIRSRAKRTSALALAALLPGGLIAGCSSYRSEATAFTSRPVRVASVTNAELALAAEPMPGVQPGATTALADVPTDPAP